MRKYKAEYYLNGKQRSLEVVAEKLKFTDTDEGGHSRAVFSNYEEDKGYVVVAAFDFTTLTSLTSEAE